MSGSKTSRRRKVPGRLLPSKRGAAKSTTSFLADEDMKEQAKVWVKGQLGMNRRNKNWKPFNVRRFQQWVNRDLLWPLLQADAKLPEEERKGLRPICKRTAANWLHELDFFCGHAKKGYAVVFPIGVSGGVGCTQTSMRPLS